MEKDRKRTKGSLLPDDARETWVERKQAGHHAGMMHALATK